MRVFLALFLFVFCLGTAEAKIRGWSGTLTLSRHGVLTVLDGLPGFSDFPSDAAPSAKTAADIDWKSNRHAWKFRTVLRDGLKAGANFDGHYAVVVYGCGSGCQGNFVVDVNDGRVLADFVTSNGALFRKDSALLVKDLFDETPIDTDAYLAFATAIEYTAVRNGKLLSLKKIDVQKAAK